MSIISNDARPGSVSVHFDEVSCVSLINHLNERMVGHRVLHLLAELVTATEIARFLKAKLPDAGGSVPAAKKPAANRAKNKETDDE